MQLAGTARIWPSGDEPRRGCSISRSSIGASDSEFAPEAYIQHPAGQALQMPLRVATYSRFSTDLQNAASAADQTRACRRYAEGWPAAGLVDTEIRFSNPIGGFHAATSVQPGVQA